MEQVLIQRSVLSEIGDAIREQSGKSELMKPSDMPSEITSGLFDLTDLICEGKNGGLSKTIYHPDVRQVRDYCFYKRSDIRAIDFPSCKSVGKYAFYSCYNLSSVNLPYCSEFGSSAFTGASQITDATLGCTVLSSVHPLINASASITNIYLPSCIEIEQSTFKNYKSLNTVYAPLVSTINKDVFYGCINLKNATLGHHKIFYSEGHGLDSAKSSLQSICFPNCIEIQQSGSTRFSGMFMSYNNLIVANFPTCKQIGYCAFKDCTALNSISFPECDFILNDAFGYCNSLVSVYFPMCRYVYNDAFMGCELLETVDLPVCINIRSSAFCNCEKLNTIILSASSVCSLWDNVFTNTQIELMAGSIFVPASLVDAYKLDSKWSVYSSIIYAITE